MPVPFQPVDRHTPYLRSGTPRFRLIVRRARRRCSRFAPCRSPPAARTGTAARRPTCMPVHPPIYFPLAARWLASRFAPGLPNRAPQPRRSHHRTSTARNPRPPAPGLLRLHSRGACGPRHRHRRRHPRRRRPDHPALGHRRPGVETDLPRRGYIAVHVQGTGRTGRMSDLRMELRVDRDGDGDVDITVAEIAAGSEVPVSLHINNHAVESHIYNARDPEQVWRELTATGKTVQVGGVLTVRRHATDKIVLREGGRLDARIWIARWNKAIHSSDWNVVKLIRLGETDDNEETYEVLLKTTEDVGLFAGE